MHRPTAFETSIRQQRPVICAIDCDELALDVLATAAVMAAQLAVPLTVVHSPDPDSLLAGEPRRLALERGNAFLDDVLTGYTVDERILDLDDPARIVGAVAVEGVSMVVIGTRCRSGLRSALLGSVSHAVVASARYPVLTVPFLARARSASLDPGHQPVEAVQEARAQHGVGAGLRLAIRGG